MASSPRVYPRSGFTSWQFWTGLAAVLGTFALGQYGSNIGVNLTGITDALNTFAKGNQGIVIGAIVVSAVTLFIAISSWFETRTIRTKGTSAVKPGMTIHAGTKPFYTTSEFWLGAVTVVLSYLHDTGVFAPDVHSSTNTATLVIALIYTFARAQIKQAYLNAQQTGS